MELEDLTYYKSTLSYIIYIYIHSYTTCIYSYHPRIYNIQKKNKLNKNIAIT